MQWQTALFGTRPSILKPSATVRLGVCRRSSCAALFHALNLYRFLALVTSLAQLVNHQVTLRTGNAESLPFKTTGTGASLSTIFLGDNPKDAIRAPAMGRDDPWSCLVRLHPRLSPLTGDGATVVKLRDHFKRHEIPHHVASAIRSLRERHGFFEPGDPPDDRGDELLRLRGTGVLEFVAAAASESHLREAGREAAAVAAEVMRGVMGGAVAAGGGGMSPHLLRPLHHVASGAGGGLDAPSASAHPGSAAVSTPAAGLPFPRRAPLTLAPIVGVSAQAAPSIADVGAPGAHGRPEAAEADPRPARDSRTY